MNQDNFKNFLTRTERKKITTSSQYATAIDKLSEHYSQQTGLITDLYSIEGVIELEKIAALYGSKGKYSEIGHVGHGTNRAAINALCRFRKNSNIKHKSDIINEPSRDIIQDKTEVDQKEPLQSQFNKEIRAEATTMSEHYEVFYTLERSIRKLVVQLMEEKFGKNWWNFKVHPDIKNNVELNMKRELSTVHTKRSSKNIDYTTFGELRQIVKQNWLAFDDEFRSISAFNDIMITLNRLRVSIAHCTPLPEDEVTRLNLTVKDWFRLIEK